jgi:peptidoglycan/xylan/chitin deacetylase (PgdA/CDA1 family)
MKHLKEHGYRIVKLSKLVESLMRGDDISGMVSVTFDDGYEDNFLIALPILKKYGIPFSVFVATDAIGGSMTNSEGVTLPMMDMRQLTEVVTGGLGEALPHTASHRPLTSYSDTAWKPDIERSRQVLMQQCGSAADIFAYPQGKYTKEIPEYLKEHGYRAAVTVREGLVSPQDDLFLLRRNSVDMTTTMAQFKGKVSAAIDVYMKLKGARNQ